MNVEVQGHNKILLQGTLWSLLPRRLVYSATSQGRFHNVPGLHQPDA